MAERLKNPRPCPGIEKPIGQTKRKRGRQIVSTHPAQAEFQVIASRQQREYNTANRNPGDQPAYDFEDPRPQTVSLLRWRRRHAAADSVATFSDGDDGAQGQTRRYTASN